MTTNRLEAFSDGVLAIVITIMVLEMKPPHDTTLEALLPVLPIFLSYVLSFIYVGIYWSNHHHLFQAAERVSGGVLWTNLHVLFWLSLIPFVTGWMGENHFATLPVALYGAVLLMAAIAWEIQVAVLLRMHARDSTLRSALGDRRKEFISLALYAVAIALAFVWWWAACAMYAAVAALWLVPDRRVERALRAKPAVG